MSSDTAKQVLDKFQGQPNAEFELRFGEYVDGKFVSGVPVNQYTRLLEWLTKNATQLASVTSMDICKGDFRMRKSGNAVEYMRKIALYKATDEEYGVRWQLSDEQKVDQKTYEQINTAEFCREKTRRSFTLNDIGSIKGTKLWRIDLTEVDSSREVEIELMNAGQILAASKHNPDILSGSMTRIWTIIAKVLHGTNNPYPKSLINNLLARFDGITLVNARNLKHDDFREGGLLGGDTVYTITGKTDGDRKQLLVSKDSGVWLINPLTKDYNWLITAVPQPKDSQTTIASMKLFLNQYDGYMFDGEWVSKDRKNQELKVPLYVFTDTMFTGYSKDIQSRPHSERRNQFNKLITKWKDKPSEQFGVFMKSWPTLIKHVANVEQVTQGLMVSESAGVYNSDIPDAPQIVINTFFPMSKDFMLIETRDKLSAAVKYINDQKGHLPYSIDGYIVTPENAPYLPSTGKVPVQLLELEQRVLTKYPDVCKIKEVKDITIDLLYRPEGLFSLGKDQSYVPFTEPFKVPPNIIPGQVIELRYEYDEKSEKGFWEYIKDRPNKAFPNSQAVVKDNLELIRHPIRTSTLMGKDLVVMRQYHKGVKGDLISNEIGSGATILDIGSGMGGDAIRWGRANLKRVYAVEPNKEYIPDLEDRTKTYAKNVDVKIIPKSVFELTDKDIPEKVDAVTMFFSATYFWHSPEEVKRLANIINDVLRPDGRVIITTLDADAILARGVTSIIEEGVYSLNVDVGKRQTQITLNDVQTVPENLTEPLCFISDLAALGRLKFDKWDWFIHEPILTLAEKNLSALYGYGVLSRAGFDPDVLMPAVEPVISLAKKHELDGLINSLMSVNL